MSDEEKFFVGEAIRHARSLPFAECLEFMRGFAGLIEQAHPAKASVQSILAQLAHTDAQLELIAVGQLKFEELAASRS